MAERELVIKIPEEIISFVNLNGFLPEEYRSAMGRVLLDGIELPAETDSELESVFHFKSNSDI